jgi:phosphoglucomutase
MDENSMSKNINPLAGKPAPIDILVDIPKLITAYYSEIPDASISNERVSFGTSGHRGSAFDKMFNEYHILAITQAICLFRAQKKIDGPLFLGMDTHALSAPAFASALEVLAANGVEVMIAARNEYTPTPVISHAILTYNSGRTTGLADGIVITPSHNPPRDGGFKYNPPSGGPANLEITSWIEKKANEFLENKLSAVKRIIFEKAINATTTHQHDYLNHYINDLGNVIDMARIKDANIHLGVDPLGGAGVHYWEPIAERYGLNLTIVNKIVDPTFRFMTVDWDGQIRMDPSSPYAMVKLIELKDRFDIAFACDTDYDRHGIVTRKGGLLQPNHYLSVASHYLFKHRLKWSKEKILGKTVVTTQMLDRIAAKLGHSLYEVPVGFKWFVDKLLNGSLGVCGEESAGATLSRMDGSVWTTDKDGLAMALLSAEITASLGQDISDTYADLENELGKTYFSAVNATSTPAQKQILSKLSPDQIKTTDFAGEKIESIITRAPGNNEAIGGLKVITKGGWFVARPSGTEEIYRIYGESFHDEKHLQRILEEAQNIVDTALKSATPKATSA